MARPAVPALVEAFRQEKDARVRALVGSALKKVDPKAAQKAGVP
jgi:hypothetical protein